MIFSFSYVCHEHDAMGENIGPIKLKLYVPFCKCWFLDVGLRSSLFDIYIYIYKDLVSISQLEYPLILDADFSF